MCVYFRKGCIAKKDTISSITDEKLFVRSQGHGVRSNVPKARQREERSVT